MARVLKVFVNIILLCAIATAGALLVPPVMGVTTYIVDSREKITNLDLGTVTYATEKPIAEFQVGDVIFDESAGGSYVYSIKKIDEATGSYDLQDKYNKEEPLKTEVLRNTASKVIFTVPFIGYVVMAMQTIEGIIIISLGVVFVIILFILAELWKKTDEDEEDEEDDQEDYEEDEDEEDEVPATRKERRALAKEKKKQAQENKQNNIQAKKKEKAFKKAQKKADKYGGAIEDYLDEDIPLLPPKHEIMQKRMEEHSVEAILAETAGELAKGIGAVTGEIPVIDESILDSITEEARGTGNDEQETVTAIQEKKERTILMPRLSAEDLIQKALADGDQPKIIEDKENGITYLDYSDII